MKIFPNPKEHPKRYIFLLGAVVYIVLKIYVSYTPSKEDDAFPEKVKAVLLQLANVDQDEQAE